MTVSRDMGHRLGMNSFQQTLSRVMETPLNEESAMDIDMDITRLLENNTRYRTVSERLLTEINRFYDVMDGREGMSWTC